MNDHANQTLEEANTPRVSKNEIIKENSNYLRGTILAGLTNPSTGALSDDDTQLTKFHGIYQQDNRDLRSERRKQKRERAYSFMARIRVPGGVCTPTQWLQMNHIADDYANGTMKLTTRQAFQFHGILKEKLKTAIQRINAVSLDTIAACGDVNRNVMCTSTPYQPNVHAQALQLAKDISTCLTPATKAYDEIWLDGVKLEEGEEHEPIYGKHYLPRKFKTVIAIPPNNDVDLFAHCLGFIAIVDKGRLLGYNVTVGGGLGTTHNKLETFPRLADVMAFCTPAQAVDVAEKVVTVQRDYGDRTDRRHARVKYTVEDYGIGWFRRQVESRLGYFLEEPRPFQFEHNGDRYGWVQGDNGLWNLTLYIEGGRIFDTEELKMKTALKKLAIMHNGDFRLTANQNLIVGNVSEEKIEDVEALFQRYNWNLLQQTSGLRLNALACVSLPTCGLALAEAERYLPTLVTNIEKLLAEYGLFHDDITIRMTGCPNGCARPYLAEIGLIGKSPGKYNLYLGAGFAGERLNKLYRTALKPEQVLETLRPIAQKLCGLPVYLQNVLAILSFVQAISQLPPQGITFMNRKYCAVNQNTLFDSPKIRKQK